MGDRFAATIREILPEIIALRHELHGHPEIRFEERWTSDRIARFLEENDIPYTRGFAKGTGIVAMLPGPEAKTVALRADIDALEIQEETGAAYASTIPHRMHACGHDGHTAVLCGAAKVLARHRDALKGTVRFIFQPAEESAGGARYMVEEGVMDGVDAVFALHAWPTIPVGHVKLRAGTMMATAGFFRVDITGKGCHGADPGAGIDPIVAAAHITTALQTITSRELDPSEAGVVTVGHIEAGSASNIIPDTALLEGTIRALTEETAQRIAQAVERIVEHTAQALRAVAKVRFGEPPYPPVINDPAMTEFVRETVVETLGADKLVEAPHPSMTAEDFAFYLQRVPGAFIWLGNAFPEGPGHPLHSARFDFNDAAITPALTLMTNLAARFLQS